MHCVEIQTLHRDGSETWQRWQVASFDDATREAWHYRSAFLDVPVGSGGQHAPGWPMPEISFDWLENDYGEPVCIRAREFGHAAQIRLGVFTVSHGCQGEKA